MSDVKPPLAGLRFAAVGMEFATIVIAAVLVGQYLDRKFGTDPFATVLLAAGGLFGAVRRLLWELKSRT